MKSNTNIPGTCSQKVTITDACRYGRGDKEAFEEAVDRLRKTYQSMVQQVPVEDGYGFKFHLVLVTERPWDAS